MIECIIEDCKRPVQRGVKWCSMHYARIRRNGDPHTKKKLWGEVQEFFRDVVLTYEGDDCLIWPFAKSDFGYAVMGKGPVYRMICEEFNGPKPSPVHQAAHECGVPACVNPKHFSWKTPSENNLDKIRHGTIKRGKENGAKLTESDVRGIRMLRGYLTAAEIASMYGVKVVTINNIFHNVCWKWLDA